MDPLKPERDVVVRTAVVGLFVLACMYTLYFGTEFFVPVTVALLLHLVLRPVMRFFNKLGVPSAAAAGLVVFGIIAVFGVAAANLLGPADHWLRDIPQITRTLQDKVEALREPMETVMKATKKVEEITQTDDKDRVQVVVRDNSTVTSVISSVPIFAIQAISTLFMLFFFLGYSGEMMDRAVELLRTRRDKRELRQLLGTVEQVLSRYLATIALINTVLGLAISGCMFAIGMPTFYLWGAMAAVLNFIPYLGSVIGIAIVTVVALVTFDSALYALLAPLSYLLCTTLEGNIVTPAVVGRQLSLNPIVIFVTIAFWAWIWGPLGALMAVPILIVMKVTADQVENLKPVGHIIGRDPLVEDMSASTAKHP